MLRRSLVNSRRWLNLVVNVARALSPRPWLLLQSFFGKADSWSLTQPPETEFSLLQPHRLPRGLQTAWNATVPALPYSEVRPYPCEEAPRNPTPRQSWLFINGICTDANLLERNAAYLHRLFGRPLTLLHNQTAGVALDLAECALGKGWLQVTEAVRKLFPVLLSELLDPKFDKVVLIAHSQGTIIAAVFLHLLRQLAATPGCRIEVDSAEARCAVAMLKLPTERQVRKHQSPRPPKGRYCRVLNPDNPSRFEEYCPCDAQQIRVAAWLDWDLAAVLGLPALDPKVLKKLEIYCFATCASDLRPIDGVPYLEHFGNQHDMVARLGMLAPREGLGCARIEGQQFERAQAWGHLLNAHYLWPLEQQWRDQVPGFTPRPGTDCKQSRLHTYLKGASGDAGVDPLAVPM